MKKTIGGEKMKVGILVATICMAVAVGFVAGMIVGATSETIQKLFGTNPPDKTDIFSVSLSKTSMTLEATGATEAPKDTSQLKINLKELGAEKVKTAIQSKRVALLDAIDFLKEIESLETSVGIDTKKGVNLEEKKDWNQGIAERRAR